MDETGVKVDKPRAASQQDIEKESILIGITAEGSVYYGGREIGIGGIRAVISRLQQEKQRPVVIQADQKTDTEKTIEALDEAKLAGAETVFFVRSLKTVFFVRTKKTGFIYSESAKWI